MVIMLNLLMHGKNVTSYTPGIRTLASPELFHTLAQPDVYMSRLEVTEVQLMHRNV